jgi:hypothetical protein
MFNCDMFHRLLVVQIELSTVFWHLSCSLSAKLNKHYQVVTQNKTKLKKTKNNYQARA